MLNIYFKRLSEDINLPVIQYNNRQAGFDIESAENKVIPAKDKAIISTGLIWQPKFKGYCKLLSLFFKIYCNIQSRSGLSAKFNIEKGAGVIDEDYRDEIKIIVYNLGYNSFTVSKGDRIAQGIVYLIPKIRIKELGKVENTHRGLKGLGSSGV